MNNRSVSALAMALISCALCFQAGLAWAEEPSAERLYEDAFKLIVEGDYGEAYDRLDQMIAKYPGTAYARLAEDRKRRLEQLNLSSIKRRKVDQSGRIESVVFGTLYSTWLGIGSARLANTESEKAVATGMMIGAPAGLMTSLTLTRNARLSNGQAALINFGGYWGTWQGLGLAIVLDEEDEKALIGSAMAGGLLGILTTSALTRKIDLSSGDACMINYGGLWGTWLSFCAGFVADIEDSDGFLGLVLAGGDLGAAAMAALAPRTEISFARVNLISLGGIVGTMVAAGATLIGQPDYVETVFAILMSGSILGLAAGCFATADMDAGGAFSQSDRIRACLKPAHTWAVSNQHSTIGSKGIQANFLSIQF